jgi:hypothetical protein
VNNCIYTGLESFNKYFWIKKYDQVAEVFSSTFCLKIFVTFEKYFQLLRHFALFNKKNTTFLWQCITELCPTLLHHPLWITDGLFYKIYLKLLSRIKRLRFVFATFDVETNIFYSNLLCNLKNKLTWIGEMFGVFCCMCNSSSVVYIIIYTSPTFEIISK